MSRTKEIEVWIHKTLPEVFGSYGRETMNISSFALRGDCIRAKLIIELPERKVTITESEFDRAWGEANLTFHNSYFIEIKQKLFSKKSEE